MSDPLPLLVPMPVQALLVNAEVRKQPFARWTMAFQNLNEFGDPDPPPFVNEQQDPPGLGVHLLWKLPSAFTHGRGTDGSQVQFPLAPNRWIVLRRATTPGATTAPTLTAWIIQSDYLGDYENRAKDQNKDKEPRSPFVDPSSTPGAVKVKQIGRAYDIEKWSGDPGGRLFLTATGVADVTFTAYQPGVSNVFSFRDDTTTLPDHTLLTYLVAGWYSDPSQDILATNTPEALDWLVLGGAPGATPTVTIPHGMVYGLEWQTKAPPPRADSNARDMQVAVGYTAVDALSAIIAVRAGGGKAGAELQTKLQAFQYDMLSTLDAEDGMAQLEQKIRNAWFGLTAGGTRWEIVPVSQGQDSDVPIDAAPAPPAPPLTGAQAKWLADLNVRQREYDVAFRELRTMQWELFALWWKSRRLAASPDMPELLRGFDIDAAAIAALVAKALDESDPTSRLSDVASRQRQIDQAAANLPDPASPDIIAAWSKRIPLGIGPHGGTPALALKPAALAPFALPSDPVLLVAGITPPANEAGVDELPCRAVGGAVTGVQVGDTTVKRDTRSMSTIITLPKTDKLPNAVATAVNALSVEAFFADPGNAKSIVVNGTGSSDAKTIEALGSAMAARTAQRATISDPLRAAFAFAKWQQAWSPLYLQWKITWLPTVGSAPIGPETPAPDARIDGDGAQDNWPFLADPWAFDGSDDVTARGSEYYRWTGGDPWTHEKAASTTYAGRTFLTPQATFLLMRRLADYVRLHPGDADLEAIERLIRDVGETRFLSQSLSGFNAGFIMHGLSRAPAPPPGSAVARAIGGENRGVPAVEVGDQSFDLGSGTAFFFPVRGGFFQIERLQIVDAFGQVLNLLQANGNTTGIAERFVPVRGSGLLPDAGAPERRVLQAPRLAQPARLDLRLLDAVEDAREVYYDAFANPVCGWLLPNHLDQAVSVYDAGGEPLGELLVLAHESGEQRVEWLPAPGAATPIGDPADIDNTHLRDMLSPFTAAAGGIPAAGRVDAFRAWYRSVDETLWMVDPPGAMADQDLAVLIGRPLAVVRAQLRFELFGRPATNQSWRDTLFDLTADLETFEVPIRLGSTELLDDGLIGYFLGDAYDRFNAVHACADAKSPYVAPVAPGNYPSLRCDYPEYEPLTLTMLVDPRASVHAITGILPMAVFQLPAAFSAEAVARMAVNFRSGPVLTLPDTIRLPFPAERNGTWAWVRRVAATGTADDWTTQSIVAATAQARLADAPPYLMDGWLKFTPAKGLLKKGDER